MTPPKSPVVGSKVVALNFKSSATKEEDQTTTSSTRAQRPNAEQGKRSSLKYNRYIFTWPLTLPYVP